MYRYYNMVTEDKKAYMKQYYDANKTRLIQQITQRQRLIRNSDKHIEGMREKLIHDLNDGTRKYLHTRTLAKYNINIDPKTLKYYHDATEIAPEPVIDTEPADDTLSDDSNDKIPDILDKTELTDTDRTTLQNYVDRYKKHKRKKGTIRLIRERLA